MNEVYHYTSLETMKLILKNCNLRFKSLGGVDDPNEEKASDFGAFGHMTYVSCWTSLKDSIPQWSMYGDNFKGVMITLRFEDVKDVFLTFKIPMGERTCRCFADSFSSSKSDTCWGVFTKISKDRVHK